MVENDGSLRSKSFHLSLSLNYDELRIEFSLYIKEKWNLVVYLFEDNGSISSSFEKIERGNLKESREPASDISNGGFFHTADEKLWTRWFFKPARASL